MCKLLFVFVSVFELQPAGRGRKESVAQDGGEFALHPRALYKWGVLFQDGSGAVGLVVVGLGLVRVEGLACQMEVGLVFVGRGPTPRKGSCPLDPVSAG